MVPQETHTHQCILPCSIVLQVWDLMKLYFLIVVCVAKHLYIDTLSLCTTHVGGLSYTVWFQLQFTCTTTKNKYLQLTLSELYFTNKIEQKIIFETHVKMEPQF